MSVSSSDDNVRKENSDEDKKNLDIIIWEDEDVTQFQKILQMPTDQVIDNTLLLDYELKIMKSELRKVAYDLKTLEKTIKENDRYINRKRRLPYLVSTVLEILDYDFQGQEDDGVCNYADAQRKHKCAVIKTTKGNVMFLPIPGLVNEMTLKPGDLVGVKRNSHLIMEKLPTEYDSRVKTMEVDKRPTERYSDIGGLDKQIIEVIESVVLPLTHKEKYDKIGIQPPKGVLIYGAPGTGKTLLARACAGQTTSTFLKLAGSQLADKYVGEGAKLLRKAFALAKQKSPAIIFIDEIDAIGTKRFASSRKGDREIQRTMIELLHQMDGFNSNDNIKVIGATNRVDILDPALLRSGRFDRKIEFPEPNHAARSSILQIHSRGMNVSSDVNYNELAAATDNFSGADCRAVCCEAGMTAFRRNASCITHEDFMDAVSEVRAKKKTNLNYFV